MEQSIQDYFTKVLIDCQDAIKFIIRITSSGEFEYGHTHSAYLLEGTPHIIIYTPQGSLYLLEQANIPLLSGLYVWGKYNRRILYHYQLKTKYDKPREYKAFVNHWRNFPGENDAATLKANWQYGARSPTDSILENKNFTFGVELETGWGRVDEYSDLNLDCVYDGSLKDETGKAWGGEYVTGILFGDTGVDHLRKIVDRLNESGCGVNSKCSVHVHIGVNDWTKEQVVMAWALGVMLEKEIFNMMPPTRRNNEFCQWLSQKYNLQLDFSTLNKLNKLDGEISTLESFNEIHSIVVSGLSKMPDRSINKMRNHPEGQKQGYKHNAQRYCWLNFVPLMFDIRNNPDARTLEFRCHSGTLNFTKILNWLKICVGFCDVVENHLREFKAGEIQTLEDVVRIAFPKGQDSLVAYIRERVKKFGANGVPEEIAEYEEINHPCGGTIKELLCV